MRNLVSLGCIAGLCYLAYKHELPGKVKNFIQSQFVWRLKFQFCRKMNVLSNLTEPIVTFAAAFAIGHLFAYAIWTRIKDNEEEYDEDDESDWEVRAFKKLGLKK